MGLLHRCTSLYQTIHLDHGYFTHRLRHWNMHLLFLSPLLLRRRCLRHLQYLQHHLLHKLDT